MEAAQIHGPHWYYISTYLVFEIGSERGYLDPPVNSSWIFQNNISICIQCVSCLEHYVMGMGVNGGPAVNAGE